MLNQEQIKNIDKLTKSKKILQDNNLGINNFLNNNKIGNIIDGIQNIVFTEEYKNNLLNELNNNEKEILNIDNLLNELKGV